MKVVEMTGEFRWWPKPDLAECPLIGSPEHKATTMYCNYLHPINAIDRT
jgi:hypothetical protein